MDGKQIAIKQAKKIAVLAPLKLKRADFNHNGIVSQTKELTKLFRLIDDFDYNGYRNSVNLGTEQSPTKPRQLIDALLEIATPQTADKDMGTLSLDGFLAEMRNKQIIIEQAKEVSTLSPLNLNRADLDKNGIISQRNELTALFRLIDDFDYNGHSNSVRLGSSQSPTDPGKFILALRKLADHYNANIDTENSIGFSDPAIKNAFPANFNATLKKGAKGNTVVAIQYALGRLGYLKSICDGSFGSGTFRSVQSFQQDNSLMVNGEVNLGTLKALDISVNASDQRPPVIQSTQSPLKFLSNFSNFNLPPILLDIRKQDFSWNHPDVQEAYGTFVEHYWEVMKENRIEADCKSLALFFMDQFRKKVAEDSGYKLPLPSSKGSLPNRRWDIATRSKTLGLFSRVAELLLRHHIEVQRRGYFVVKKIQTLDPNHSMIYGVNVKYPRVSAHQVSRAATTIHPWNTNLSNKGNHKKVEIPLHDLQAGHIVFIDHRGDDHYDHTVNIIKVKRDENNAVRKLTLAVGSYDDVRDSLASTVVNSLNILNQYSEEVVVEFDSNELITDSIVTYSSEPSYIVRPRYSAVSTLMEMKPGGTLKVCRWGE